MRPRGWPLTGWTALALLAMSALVLAAAGTDEAGVRMLIRATARSSAVLFLATFVARPLRQLWRSAASAYLLANRRYLGVSMACSHLLHGLAIVWLFTAWPSENQARVSTLAGGGLGFVLIALMAATSSDAAVRALGRARWQTLHRIGSWYTWLIFAVTFLPDATPGWDLLHGSFVAAFLGAAALRGWAFLRRRQRDGAPKSP